MPLIELKGIYKTYREGQLAVNALRAVNLTISENRFTVIRGRSGSGKTTLMNLLGCIDRQDAGVMRILGVDSSTLGDHELTKFRGRKIGFIFQNFNLMPMLSARENVEYALFNHPISPRERKTAAIEILSAVGLTDFQDHKPNQLSGGQRQRVAIARALVKYPAIVIADEPTANLDTHTASEIISLMNSMRVQRNITFIFSTHDPNLMGHADSIVELSDGMIVN